MSFTAIYSWIIELCPGRNDFLIFWGLDGGNDICFASVGFVFFFFFDHRAATPGPLLHWYFHSCVFFRWNRMGRAMILIYLPQVQMAGWLGRLWENLWTGCGVIRLLFWGLLLIASHIPNILKSSVQLGFLIGPYTLFIFISVQLSNICFSFFSVVLGESLGVLPGSFWFWTYKVAFHSHQLSFVVYRFYDSTPTS